MSMRSPRQQEIDEIAALAMGPLVELAWADGHVTPGEHTAVLEAARIFGLDQRSEFCRSTLKRWLHSKPEPETLDRWRVELAPALSSAATRSARKIARRLLTEAERIAKMDERPFEEGASVDPAAGITEEERRILDDLAATLAGVHEID